jgi:hypothetical protein
MLNATHLPPTTPPTPLELIALCLENPGVTKEAIKEVALEISGYNAKARALELARQQHEQHVQADREQLAREREALEAAMAQREADLQTKIGAFELRLEEQRQYGAELKRRFDLMKEHAAQRAA